MAREQLLAYGLSFLMGLQNAVVTRISNARVRTTHITGMVTDIGSELGNLVDLAWHRRSQRENDEASDYDEGRLWLHGFTVISFVGGGGFGVLAYKKFGPTFLFGAALRYVVHVAAAQAIAQEHGTGAGEDGGALSALEREGQRRAVGNQRPHTVDGAAPFAGRIIHASCWPPSRAIP